MGGVLTTPLLSQSVTCALWDRSGVAPHITMPGDFQTTFPHIQIGHIVYCNFLFTWSHCSKGSAAQVVREAPSCIQCIAILGVVQKIRSLKVPVAIIGQHS